MKGGKRKNTAIASVYVYIDLVQEIELVCLLFSYYLIKVKDTLKLKYF